MEVYDEYGQPVRFHALVALPTVDGGVVTKHVQGYAAASVSLNDYAGEITRLLDRGDVSGKHLQEVGLLVLLAATRRVDGEPVVAVDAFSVPLSPDMLEPGHVIRVVHRFIPKAVVRLTEENSEPLAMLDTACVAGAPTTCYWWRPRGVLYYSSEPVCIPLAIVDVAPSNGLDSPAQRIEGILVLTHIFFHKGMPRIDAVADLTQLGGATVLGPSHVIVPKGNSADVHSTRSFVEAQCGIYNVLVSIPGSLCSVEFYGPRKIRWHVPVPDFNFSAYVSVGLEGRIWVTRYTLEARECSGMVCSNKSLGDVYIVHAVLTDSNGAPKICVEVQDDYNDEDGVLAKLVKHLRNRTKPLIVFRGDYSSHVFDYYNDLLARVAPGAPVTGDGIGLHQVLTPIGSLAAALSCIDYNVTSTIVSGISISILVYVDTSRYSAMMFNSEVAVDEVVLPSGRIARAPVMLLRP
ncbi:hypothetical protein [Pyrodictium abyssi]|uniref:Uncharacterized protein n=1 Tax=Pyrodictium abyssi TaxID=54256 RepID=A0ABM8IVK2_9CREN|nr:hypothetical protein PABY_11460 [Pyrodictium abyssi]